MITNIYSPLSGALAHEKVLDIIANNLANMNTVAYKEESVSFKLLAPEPYKNYHDPLPPANFKIDLEQLLPLRGNEVSYVGVSGVARDNSQGSPIKTENPLDIMIKGEGFFAFQTQDGMRYGRNGALTLNHEGALVDKNGYPLQGEKGTIYLHGKDIEINPLGEVYQDGELVDKILVHKVQNPEHLEKVGMNHYYYTGPQEGLTQERYPALDQGYLESSNVNPIKNLTAMILTHRSYEAYQQAIKNFDTLMEKSSNEIGKIQA